MLQNYHNAELLLQAAQSSVETNYWDFWYKPFDRSSRVLKLTIVYLFIQLPLNRLRFEKSIDFHGDTTSTVMNIWWYHGIFRRYLEKQWASFCLLQVGQQTNSSMYSQLKWTLTITPHAKCISQSWDLSVGC